MTSVRKSPNMMSTTGRIPVMAAPSAMPVKPGSEIGVSMTRSVPNSSTRPFSTLKGVPASATPSPRMKTAGSRRISSASASLTAWPMVSWRRPSAGPLSVDILGDLRRVGEGGFQPERDARCHLGPDLLVERLQLVGAGGSALCQARGQQRDRVPVAKPGILLLPGSVVRAVDVAHVVAAVAVGVAEQKARSLTGPRPLDRSGRGCVHRHHVLAVDLGRLDAERPGARGQVARRRLQIVGVLVVEVVLADVDHRQAPERSHVHRLVEQALTKCPIAEEADGHLIGAAPPGRHRGAGRDAPATADDRVGAQVAPLLVGDVHRTALAPAVAGLLAKQIREHPVYRRPLGQAVTVAAMGAGDVVVALSA